MNRSETINELATALALAQAELRNPGFDSTNPHFKSKFASLAGVRDTITPTLAKYGIAVLQLLGFDDGRVTCETVLTHKSGQWISGTFSMAPTKPDAQGTGSAATYCRRYALMAIVNVVGDEDDDGNAAAGRQNGRSVVADEADKVRVIRDTADACIALHAAAVTQHDKDGDVSGFWELHRAASKITGEDRMLLWEMLAKHSAVRSAIKEYAGYAAAEKSKVPA